MVLGVHDLRFSSQTIMVDQVFNLPDDGRFPPKSDLSLLRLSAPARLSKHLSAPEPRPGSWLTACLTVSSVQRLPCLRPRRGRGAQ